jgi:hypothetical protein
VTEDNNYHRIETLKYRQEMDFSHKSHSLTPPPSLR